MIARLFASAALAALVGGADRTMADGTLPKWDGIYLPCGGGAPSATNPFGLRGRLSVSPDVNRHFIEDARDRAAAVQQRTGKPVRLLFHQPGGWFAAKSNGMRGAIATVPVMNGRKKDGSELYPWRWDLWADEIRAIAIAHPDWVLGVYFSAYVPTAAAEDVVDAPQGYEPYDDENVRHRALMLGAVEQWLDVGIEEFVLDNSSAGSAAVDMAPLAQEIRNLGGRLVLEAHPLNNDATINDGFEKSVGGSLSLHRYMVEKEPASLSWKVPTGTIMMVVLSQHEISSQPWRSTPTLLDVANYRMRGFTVLSSGTSFDSYLQ